jgi:ribonuclease BN (tRNA processing enzyme)
LKIQLLPSSVGEGPSGGHQYLTTYLINDDLAVDAGCLGFYAGPAEQSRVRHVLITHAHIDHIASLPVFLENIYDESPDCVTVHGSDDVLTALRSDIFNDRIWPDFPRFSEGERKFLRFSLLEPYKTVDLCGVRFTPVPMNHQVPTFGFLLEDAGGSVVLASDTRPTEAIWQAARKLPNLRAAFLECAFPNRMQEIADLADHLTPQQFAGEVAKLERPEVAWLAVHLKPKFRTELEAELAALGLPNVQSARIGREYHF